MTGIVKALSKELQRWYRGIAPSSALFVSRLADKVASLRPGNGNSRTEFAAILKRRTFGNPDQFRYRPATPENDHLFSFGDGVEKFANSAAGFADAYGVHGFRTSCVHRNCRPIGGGIKNGDDKDGPR